MSGIDAAGQLICTGGTPPPVNYTLSVSRSGAGSGTVTSVPSGTTCGSTCNASYTAGQVVTLTAAPLGSSVFAGWTGACTGTSTCTVTMNASTSVTATFAPITYSLSVATSGPGTITGTPGSINCGPSGTTCSATYSAGQTVTLTAVPSSGNMFTGWTGGGCSGTGTCVVFMDAAKSVVANFATQMYPLTVSVTGSGSVTPSGGSYASGTAIVLLATPATGSTFLGWSGACSGPSATCVVTMTSAKSVSATFSP